MGTPKIHLPMNREGDQAFGFTCTKATKGWGGAYGQTWRRATWTCDICGRSFNGDLELNNYLARKIVEHHKCGHAPCALCGQMLMLRKDGSPRQHAYTRCPAKSSGYKIESEFIKNIERREYT